MIVVRLVLMLGCAAAVSVPARAQSAPVRATPSCAAISCEEELVLALAIDSVVRHARLPQREPQPTFHILASVHIQPFRQDGRLSPAVGLNRTTDFYSLRRLGVRFAVTDSAGSVASDGVSVRDGAALLILAPLSWRGEDVAIARLALYAQRIDLGQEYFVRLERRDARWRVVRIELGWQN